MQDFWLKTGCFLTGYNYSIIRNSSEESAATVKKYLSAILIVTIIWAFIGYVFSNRYLHTNTIGSVLVSTCLVILIIQIERQIILAAGKNRLAMLFRAIIAVVMAIIGSVIIDQIIFKDDVEKRQISLIQHELDEILPLKTTQLDNETENLENLILQKESERTTLIAEITNTPFIKGNTTERRNHILQIRGSDGSIRDTLIARTDATIKDIPNPKADYITVIDDQIAQLRYQISQNQHARINIRQDLENELKSRTGFLDEFIILFSILTDYPIALFIWICLFIFFLAIELFVLVNKMTDPKTDYDLTIQHQKETKIKMLEQFKQNIIT